jgi:hypothetical protein
MRDGLGALVGVAISLACVGAWFQHLYTCFNEHLWGFLIAGAIFFPVAIIHGFGIWFGFWH